jgi:hypothetical protein
MTTLSAVQKMQQACKQAVEAMHDKRHMPIPIGSDRVAIVRHTLGACFDAIAALNPADFVQSAPAPAIAQGEPDGWLIEYGDGSRQVVPPDRSIHQYKALGCKVTPLYAALPAQDKDANAGGHPAPANESESVPYVIFFDDADCKPEMIIGREAAMRRYEQISDSWNAHLFVKIDSNSRGCQYPNAGGQDKQDAIDAARLDWLQEQTVDTIYFDDGRILDVGGKHQGNLRNAIDAAMQAQNKGQV